MSKRLTQRNENGTWSVQGIKWADTPKEIYGALCKLRDYEDTGFSPNEIESMKTHVCDSICRWPHIEHTQEDLDWHCERCVINRVSREDTAEADDCNEDCVTCEVTDCKHNRNE